MAKVIVIGGGISGLSAAIHAQMEGYQTEIFEKNATLGGECSGWNRNGYHIDNCIHWLTGTKQTDKLFKVWETLGVLSKDTELIYEDYFYRLSMDGKTLTLWRDLDRARKEFIGYAPEDEEQLNMFFDGVKDAECLQIPCEKSIAEMGFIEYMKYGMQMAPMGKTMKLYGKESVRDFSLRFKNPLVTALFTCYFNLNYPVMALITSYSFYVSRTGAIPKGGSVGMIKNMCDRYERLGGVLHTGMSATEVIIQGKKATGVRFATGQTVECDAVICATDTDFTFHKLIDEKYMDKKLRTMYTNHSQYEVSSGFNVSFGIIGKEDYGVCGGSTIFACEPYTLAGRKHDLLGVRVYDYDESLFPQDKRVIQTNFLQDEEEFAYWEKLYEDRDAYNAEKQRVAEEIKYRIIKEYPELEGHLEILCTYSPYTFKKWCGAYRGAYMSFIGTNNAKSLYVRNSIKGLKNVFISSQWLQLNGGLPLSAASGKFAVDALKKAVKIEA